MNEDRVVDIGRKFDEFISRFEEIQVKPAASDATTQAATTTAAVSTTTTSS